MEIRTTLKKQEPVIQGGTVAIRENSEVHIFTNARRLENTAENKKLILEIANEKEIIRVPRQATTNAMRKWLKRNQIWVQVKADKIFNEG